ncbi:MAG: phytase [Gammaproteobacteria bacterium]|nr:phytase [Gammaproteobacteria bacterium]
MVDSIWQSFLLIFSMFYVGATTETEPSPYPGDSVDDIAVWVNAENPSRSLILATLKNNNQTPSKPLGILVYDLQGKQIQFLQGGSPNNIDIRYGYDHDGQQIPIIAVSHWQHNDVSLLTIDPNNLKLVQLTIENIDTGLLKARGLCLYKNNNQFYYFVISNLGEVRQFRIHSDAQWSASQVRQFSLGSSAEGCVVDDFYNKLYIAEESVGIWRYDADPKSKTVEKIIDLNWLSALKADLEGLAIYDSGDGKGYLIVSSQGNSRFVIYDRLGDKHLGTFGIEPAGDIDGTSKTDGIDASSVNYGSRFPSGFFIAHDDANESPEGVPRHQNFKIVDWRVIQQQLDKIKIATR